MGFWHTGYMEFHEPVGLEGYVPEYIPPVYQCKHCEETFASVNELRTHRFESHPYSRPILFLRGIEAGTNPVRITKPLKKGDVQTSRCKHVEINGVPLSPSAIGEKLSSETNDTVTVRLTNEGISAEFVLRFEIASEEDLAGIEHCFLDVARSRRLDMRAVEDFIRATETFPTAIGYCNGICEYFYGVLAKERSADSSLPFEKYREKFARAEDALKDFDRPLVRVIRALIAFHFNQFNESIDLAGKSRVGIASGRFERWIAGDTIGANRFLSRTSDSRIEELLTDFESERLIKWCVADPKALVPQLQDIESLIHQDILAFDRTKLRVLLAELYANQRSVTEAKNHARELRNSPVFGLWAENLLHRLTDEKQPYA
ncbi:C2H2-type zinc finger protein [Candidatus Spongiihabitans sp.]|uniref:C2H2-type zinc finger protein n=1 Tax=Candidatus Spongiihabitans sp. TaxID=3101308 RepID=UPI003C7D9C6C